LGRVGADWLAKAKEQSVRCVVEAQAPEYDPQSPAKKLAPWGSGIEEREDALDRMLEEWEDRSMDDEPFASCWDRN
jgi:hypothetical protein